VNHLNVLGAAAVHNIALMTDDCTGIALVFLFVVTKFSCYAFAGLPRRSIIFAAAAGVVETSEDGKKIIFICNERSALRSANALLQKREKKEFVVSARSGTVELFVH
jgi:hypothetical protein